MIKKTAFGMMMIFTILLYATAAFSHASYTGYSGAPGATGRCASSCHGSTGGTIQIAGFPTEYMPGQIYAITVSHAGGSSIRQFNASIRVGSGSQNAGTIAASTRTAIYNVSGETNGVRLSSNSQNDGIFLWTAPQTGVGAVKLYLAGLQGNMSGQNTALALTANQIATGIEDSETLPDKFELKPNYPNPFNAQTNISFSLVAPANITLNIYNVIGQKIATLAEGYFMAGEHSLNWDASNQPGGVYFCRLIVGANSSIRKITFLK